LLLMQSAPAVPASSRWLANHKVKIVAADPPGGFAAKLGMM
jgi:hypothetical protein